VRADEDLHALIFRFAGHATAWQWLEGAKAQMDRVRYLAMSVLRKQSTVLAEHADIIEGHSTQPCQRQSNLNDSS